MASIQFCGVSKVFRGDAKDVAGTADEASSGDGRYATKTREIRAVDGIDLEVRSGELLVLMGPSGSGKTTLLRLIAGLEEPTTGSVRIDGQDQRGIAARDRNIAMVFQGLSLYGHLTARENLEFGLRMRSSGSRLRRWFGSRSENDSEIDRAVSSVADRLGIAALLDKRPGELSGGEQQRVAIGRALVRQPKVFLLDEPLASLDGPTRFGLRREIKQLQRQLGVTAVYVTHDQGEALALGDRIAVLHRGRLQQVGSPEQVYRQPANRLVASLFGGLGMSFVTGRVERSDAGWNWKCGSWRLALPAPLCPFAERGDLAKAVIGVRPDEVAVATHREHSPGWSAVVEAVDYQGAATYAQVRGFESEAGGQPPVLLARLQGEVQPGERALLQLNLENVCWFDSDSGANLGINAAGEADAQKG